MRDKPTRQGVRVLFVPTLLFVIMLAGLVGALVLDGWAERVAVAAVAAFLPVLLFVLWISPRGQRQAPPRRS